ncbi:Transcriptional repressor PaaX [Ruegeria sp. THAF57]|uniref:hypothetical protein n=1 Tax=Ruegeria sp. THAF57 TaxID=2744555 RepID=UPI0015DD945D|nr:hypothetical protein [Ruegeria sp. THAF57]CAD0187027.1 Transcriptional repressor PaaX [Ruegeria sp. THAF57]
MTAADALIDDLCNLEPIKTWSLIVTLFGDLSDHHITGKELGLLMGHVGIKTEAIRVALHRLRKDGWIVSTKSGREVTYSLSDVGLAETRAAYEDVYRRDVKYPQGWKLLLTKSDYAAPDPAIRIERSLLLVPVEAVLLDGAALGLQADTDHIPDWFSDRIVPSQTLVLAQKLCEIAERPGIGDLSPLSLAAVRLLLLHYWRKIALRNSSWAHISMIPQGPLAQCHHRVTQVMADLPRLDPAAFAN